jgi:hypothetical protein
MSGSYDVDAAIQQAADVISRASICFLVVGQEFAEECGSIASLKDLSSLNIPGLSHKKVWDAELLDKDPSAFYGIVIIPNVQRSVI